MILLVVHVNDITITRDDTKKIDSMKYLQKHFQTKDHGSLRFFLSIEVAGSKKSILSQKSVLDLLSEAEMLRCKSIEPS